eukprot:m.554110 g.554110  ORF g.554110 m.554110 type:complete len:176 (-) comp22175_c0_seq1:2309-2836(-)
MDAALVAIRDWLLGTTKWFFVLEDVHGPGIWDVIPKATGGRLVLTSQSPLHLEPTFDCVKHSLQLSPLPLDACMDLLRSLKPFTLRSPVCIELNGLSDAELRARCTASGFHPIPDPIPTATSKMQRARRQQLLVDLAHHTEPRRGSVLPLPGTGDICQGYVHTIARRDNTPTPAR